MLQTASGLEDLIPARSPVRMKLALPQKPYIVWTEAGWEEGKGTISITNHSNTDVNASASYEAAEGFETANMEFSENDLTVGSADNGEDGGAGTAVKETITVTPSGTLPEETENEEIGHITVTIK